MLHHGIEYSRDSPQAAPGQQGLRCEYITGGDGTRMLGGETGARVQAASMRRTICFAHSRHLATPSHAQFLGDVARC